MIDCGPSRFAIWRRLRNETVESVLPELVQVFRERGPPAELLMDNSQTFRAGKVQQALASWNVTPVYRCAYRPAGNGIVERHHRTIKRMAARSNADPLQMVYFYNVTPKTGTSSESVPANELHRYSWRLFGADEQREIPEVESRCREGDLVYVKPPAARCTTTWPVGRVTGVQTATRVEVDGVPRHVADLRLVPRESDADESDASDADDGDADESAEESGAEADAVPAIRASTRTRTRPDWYGNNVFTY
jgi:hypothetical protein